MQKNKKIKSIRYYSHFFYETHVLINMFYVYNMTTTTTNNFYLFQAMANNLNHINRIDGHLLHSTNTTPFLLDPSKLTLRALPNFPKLVI